MKGFESRKKSARWQISEAGSRPFCLSASGGRSKKSCDRIPPCPVSFVSLPTIFIYMKLAIISDTHGNLANIETALGKISEEKASVIIHCGDIGGPKTLQVFEKFCGKVFAVLGNMDEGYFSKEDFEPGHFSNAQIKLFGSENSVGADLGEVTIDNKKIAITHFPKIARDLAKSQKYDLVFCGHTHCPHQEKIGKTDLINPGNLSNLLYRPSFAVYDTEIDKLELKVL